MRDFPEPFPPTRVEALSRLSGFVLKAARDYASLRNYDLPGHPHVSQLSPYIRHRVITESEVCEAVLGRFSERRAEKFIQEVCWRTYWKAWLERRPAVWGQYLESLQAAQNRLATEAGLRARFKAACTGQTEIDGFDGWAQELTRTGYLHNHARMWFASIWIFTLELPWALGADFFMRHLLDGDPASNTLSWRWVAGLQTVGKTYAARASNISKYTEGRANPVHQVANADQIAPLSGPPAPAPRDVPQSVEIQADLRTGLLITEDDLSPNFVLDQLDPSATAILITPQARSPLVVSEQVVSFTRALAADTQARYTSRLGEIPIFETAEEVIKWAQTHDLEQIVLPYTFTGPAKTQLKKVEKEIPLAPQIRPWDAAALPHAKAGFFKFKANIPALLATL